MARQNRRDIFDNTEVGVYHAVQRTVRRAWLCGNDPISGRSFEHRRRWIEDKLKELAAYFAIDCLSYAVMVNHVHLLVRNRPDVVETWSDEEVARRWWYLFPGRRNTDKSPCNPTDNELKSYAANARLYRMRLSDVSWFMRAFAEPIARMSNYEDRCTGRFWEGRFKLQKLVDEAAVLACSAYVDLNPVRAGAADTPETSVYTSIYTRIESKKEELSVQIRRKLQKRRKKPLMNSTNVQKVYVRRDEWLAPITIDSRGSNCIGPMPSHTNKRASDKGFLAMTMEAYLNLLDWTGRQIRHDGKSGRIPKQAAPILNRIGLSKEVWLDVVRRFGKIFARVAGKPESLSVEAMKRGQIRLIAHSSPFQIATG